MSKRRRAALSPPGGGRASNAVSPPTPWDDADEYLNREEGVRSYEGIGPGEARVVARATMFPIYMGTPRTMTIRLTDKPQVVSMPLLSSDQEPQLRVFQPPNGIVQYRFDIEPTDESRVFRTYMAARAVRNYLAFVVGMPIPLRYVLLAKGFMFRQNFEMELTRYHPPEETDPVTGPAFYSRIEAAYPRTELLLKTVDPTSPLGRAISSVGRAIWNEDDEDAFLAAWRGVDIVSKMDYKAAMAATGSKTEALQAPYHEAERKSAEGGMPPRVSDLAKVRITACRRLADVPQERVAQMNELRGIIAHDVLDAARFRTIRQDKWEMITFARKVVESALADPLLKDVPDQPSGDEITESR